MRLSLDTFERVQRAAPRPELHHRIEHIEVIDPSDLPRFAALGVVASMQPFHANPFGDEPDAGVWSRNLGARRLPLSFPWRMLHRARAPLVSINMAAIWASSEDNSAMTTCQRRWS